jgi:hypothetical protein
LLTVTAPLHIDHRFTTLSILRWQRSHNERFLSKEKVMVEQDVEVEARKIADLAQKSLTGDAAASQRLSSEAQDLMSMPTRYRSELVLQLAQDQHRDPNLPHVDLWDIGPDRGNEMIKISKDGQRQEFSMRGHLEFPIPQRQSK